MYKRKLVGIAVAATITIFCAVKADAESEASFQAGSSAGASLDSEANGENGSQATSANTTLSINEQDSRATSANASDAASEEIGGALTNSGPGNTNTANPSNVINGGSGYFNAYNFGNPPASIQNRPPVNTTGILPDPSKKDVGVGMTHRLPLSHVPVAVVKTYRWSKHKQTFVSQTNSHLF
jgi:hypothetical protein